MSNAGWSNSGVGWVEIVWVLLSGVGLGIWLANFVSAMKTYVAIRDVIGDGRGADPRMIYSRFALSETALFTFVECIFLVLGGISMAIEGVGGRDGQISWLFTGGSILVAVLICGLGFQWQYVDRAVIKASVRRRRTPPSE
jgi:hypothetical protein